MKTKEYQNLLVQVIESWEELPAKYKDMVSKHASISRKTITETVHRGHEPKPDTLIKISRGISSVQDILANDLKVATERLKEN